MPSLDRLRDKLKCPACLDGRKPWKAPHPPNSIGTLGLERFISESRCYVRGTKRPPPELGRILRASIISTPVLGRALGLLLESWWSLDVGRYYASSTTEKGPNGV